jgi:hypothetical protein
MPPRGYLEEILETLLPESPFLLAAETILVLVPHPLDPNPKSSNSKRLRTAASAALGKKTMEAVEAVLASKERSLEVPQALAMLSMWEWGNAGNLSLNRARANQSLQVLMEMGINIMDNVYEYSVSSMPSMPRFRPKEDRHGEVVRPKSLLPRQTRKSSR